MNMSLFPKMMLPGLHSGASNFCLNIHMHVVWENLSLIHLPMTVFFTLLRSLLLYTIVSHDSNSSISNNAWFILPIRMTGTSPDKLIILYINTVLIN